MALAAHLLRSLVLMGCAAPAFHAADGAPTYAVTTTLAVGGEGRWDYVACSAAGDRLYVPRSSHVMVLDATSGAVIADIPGTKGVHGVALAPDAGRGFTSNGGDGTVTIFDLTTSQVLGSIAAKPDADCIIYDPASRLVLAFCGDEGVVVPIPADVAVGGTSGPAVDLGGKPEYAVADGHGKVYVNLVDKDQVAVLDTKTLTVTARWPTAPGARPTGLSMDREGGRLFIGCRNQKLVVMGADDGHVIADLPIGPGVDATAFSAGSALASCGDGTLVVARPDAAGRFTVAQTVTTLAGARTMAVDATGRHVYLPTAEMDAAPAPSAANAHPRPTPKAGTFKILVVGRTDP